MRILAAVGALGTVVNLLVRALLVHGVFELVARFLFASKVVYRPKPVKRVARNRTPRNSVKEVSA